MGVTAAGQPATAPQAESQKSPLPLPLPHQGGGILRLLTWLSPAFPTGGFAYSHGLEQAVRDGDVAGADSLFDWLAALVDHGSTWTDAVLLAAAWRGEPEAAELAAALAPSQERLKETLAQGEAFARAVSAGWPEAAPQSAAYCVAVGEAAARCGAPLHDSLVAFLHAFCGNLVGAAIRTVPIGQSDGVRTLARLEPVILAAAARAAASTLDDLGSAALVSDIASMRHADLQPRLFIS
jgi:urease accessory protein